MYIHVADSQSTEQVGMCERRVPVRPASPPTDRRCRSAAAMSPSSSTPQSERRVAAAAHGEL